jgi:hypothetical protein
MLALLRTPVSPIFVGMLLGACARGNLASQLVRPPDFSPKGETKCGVMKSQAKPLIVEWPSSDRLELETKVREGIVAVRYVGCEMSVLGRCSVPAKYKYIGGTRKQDELDIKDEDDLYANLPVGAASLQGRLERSGRLTVKMDLVGRYQSEKTEVRADELQGACEGATHFIYGLTLGAFDFYAGGGANVGGGAGVGGVAAGAHSQAERESISRDGEAVACERATSADTSPPEGCAAILRVEVVQLGTTNKLVSTCPEGTQWDGSQCVNKSHPLEPPSCVAGHCTLRFLSGPTWSSYSGVAASSGAVTDALGSSLGAAAPVCVEPSRPNCPSGAVLYHGTGANAHEWEWTGGESLSPAQWIWRGDVTTEAQGALQVAVFEKTFTLGAHPTGEIRISADDFAEVFVNHAPVGSIGSVFDIAAARQAQSVPTTMDLSAALRAGENTIAVVGQNGPFACTASNCPYARNPAGVVFAGTLRW